MFVSNSDTKLVSRKSMNQKFLCVSDMSCKRLVFEGAKVGLRLDTLQRVQHFQDKGNLVKVVLSSICPSDIHTFQGRRIENTPSVLGHEGLLYSEEYGRFVAPVYWNCGKCIQCDERNEQKCENLMKYGHVGISSYFSGLSGYFSEFLLLKPGTTTRKISPMISDQVAATVNCALSTMMSAINAIPDKIMQKHQCKIIFVGDGLLSVYGSTIIRTVNSSAIISCIGNTRTFRRPILLKFGFNDCHYVKEGHFKPCGDADVVIETCGNRLCTREALDMLKVNGYLILTGLVHSDSLLEFMGEKIVRKLLTIKGIHNYTLTDFNQAVDWIEEHFDKFPFDDLFLNECPPVALDEYKEAFKMATQRKDIFRVFMKA
ncbi:hypothetical protein ACOME3_007912 [Neoechinorhynchus agilis]